jgi:hypothetical protein
MKVKNKSNEQHNIKKVYKIRNEALRKLGPKIVKENIDLLKKLAKL